MACSGAQEFRRGRPLRETGRQLKPAAGPPLEFLLRAEGTAVGLVQLVLKGRLRGYGVGLVQLFRDWPSAHALMRLHSVSVYWYLIRFAGKSPYSYSALDIKTYAMAILGQRYRHTTKRNMPRHWFDDLPHSHVALDDAIEQGALFCNMLAERERR